MTQITPLPFSPSKAAPDLADLLDLLKRDILLNFSAHHVGTIQSFNATKQTATVTVNYKRTKFRLNSATGQYEQVLYDYPILADCPVMFLGGGTSALTFPVNRGDECLILFNDRDLDNWFLGASGASVATARLHSFTDGIILVGLRSLAHTLPNFDTTRASLRNGPNGTTMVGVGETLIKIANTSTTLNTLLQNLISNINDLVTQVAAITVICAAPSNPSSIPVNVALIEAVAVELAATSTQIAGLLE